MAEDKGKNQFLEFLRASDGGFQQAQELPNAEQSGTSASNVELNEETVRASNVATNNHERALSSLPDLFAPPDPSVSQSRKTINALKKPQTPTVLPPIQPRTTIQDGTLPPRPRSASVEMKRPDPTNNSVLPSSIDDESLDGEKINLVEDVTTEITGTEIGTNVTRQRSSSLSGQPIQPLPSALSPRSRTQGTETFQYPNGSPPIRPPPIHARDRSVSFDAQAMQKVYDDQQQQQHEQQLMRERARDGRIINLDDILGLGPYEVEAETNILKALEDQPTHRRFRSETSTILSNVPEHMEHDFDIEGYDQVERRDSDVGTSSFENATSSGRGPSTAEDKDIEQGVPLLVAKKPHRRTMSVEDRLAGLTVEISQLGKPKPNDNKASADSQVDLQQLSSNNNQSTAQIFRQNAAALATSSEDSSSLPSKSKPSDRDIHTTLSRVDEGENENGSTSSSSHLGENGAGFDERNRGSRLIAGATETLKDDWEVWSNFFNPRREHVSTFMKTLVFYFALPLVAVAAILFYGFDNPPTGLSPDGSPGSRASASWWLLFVLRQAVTFSVALLLQLIFIDFLAVGTRMMLRLVGPILTLLIVQSKGWPFVCFVWSMLNFGLLYGDRPIARHWLYWQNSIEMCNNKNPSGLVVDSSTNATILTIFACVSIGVAIKRFVVGLFLSRNTFNHYGEQLAKVMSKILLVSQVAQLAKKISRSRSTTPMSTTVEPSKVAGNAGTLKRIYSEQEFDEDNEGSIASSVKSEVTDMRSVQTKRLVEAIDDTNKMKLLQLLESWEEPDRQGTGIPQKVSITAVLRFRNALNMINKENAFSLAFGPTHSRDACIESSQHVYSKLQLANPAEEYVHFETLGVIALDPNGAIDEDKAKELVKAFRPRRDGVLTMLDFIRSVDSIYKELRLLEASIENSSQIDRAFEHLIDVIFYAVVLTLILHFLGFNPLAFFLSLTSVILAFAFMIGTASSRYFEGILFILVRRPYDIGDIVHFSHPEETTNVNGSIGWIVQNVTLFETVGTWVPTLERASFNNGSLASSQIINWARSPNARINVQLNFPIETKYEQIEIFKRAIEEYMRIRPREWLQLNGFRVNRIYTEQSYMNVTLLIQHREPWQSIGQILDSKANLVTYCNEVQKKLGMKYCAPPVPVDLKGAAPSGFLEHNNFSSVGSGGGGATGVVTNTTDSNSYNNDSDSESKMNHFRMIAKTQHKIRAG